MLLAQLVATSREVTAARSRRRKIAALATCLAGMAPEEVAVGAAYLAGQPRQERLDVGWSTLRSIDAPPAGEATLALADVDAALEQLVGLRGAGSRSTRLATLRTLFAAATAGEQRFLWGLVLGELRQGALAGLAGQAVAVAWDVPEAEVRRALMLRADLGTVASAAAIGGREALRAFGLELFRPVQPMLAQTAASLPDAIGALGQAVVEWKLDGARVQVHRRGEEVRVYTRNLRDVTARSPEVVTATAALPVDTVVIDGEVIALRDDERPHPFQDTMRRFGAERAVEQLVLRPFFFDCLHVDGEDLLDRSLAERTAALATIVPIEQRIPHAVVSDPDEATRVFEEAVAAGHEGVMVKNLDAPYEAGRRGAAWRKVKPVHTVDLVVLAAEWGSGRRRGWLSNLHLGARDPTGGFVMLGKTFKGLTDATLSWQTRRLLGLEQSRDGLTVWVRPELVVEIAFDGLQASTRYPGGVALRFARVKRYREDKPAAEADTIDTVRALHTEAGVDRRVPGVSSTSARGSTPGRTASRTDETPHLRPRDR